MTLSLRLKQARNEAGWSLKQAAERAHVDLNMLWQYEAGLHKPSTLALRGLAHLYGKQVEWFEIENGVSGAAEDQGAYSKGAGDQLMDLGPHYVLIVGTVSAGGMVEGWGEDLGYWPVTWELLKTSPNAKALRVSGDSLASEGIYDGNIVIIDPDQREIIDGLLYAVRSEEYNQTMAARRIYTVGRRRLKLVSGDGDVVEVQRSKTTIEGRIIKAFSEKEL